MRSSETNEISSTVGSYYDRDVGSVIIYDTRGQYAVSDVELSDDEMRALVAWYTDIDGLCPACFQKINVDHIVCDDCLEKAKSAISRN